MAWIEFHAPATPGLPRLPPAELERELPMMLHILSLADQEHASEAKPPGLVSATSALQLAPQDPKNITCFVCYTVLPTVALECGHCLCSTCYCRWLDEENHLCWFCRQPVTSSVRLFLNSEPAQETEAPPAAASPVHAGRAPDTPSTPWHLLFGRVRPAEGPRDGRRTPQPRPS